MLDLERLRELELQFDILRIAGFLDGEPYDEIKDYVRALEAENKRLNDFMNSQCAKLLEQLVRVEKERDAAICALEKYAHNVHTCQSKDSCDQVTANHAACFDCPNWQWRGARNEEGVG